MTAPRLADYKAMGLDQTGEIVECFCGWRGPKSLVHCDRCTIEKGTVEGRGRHHAADYAHKGDCKRCRVREAVRYDRRHREDPNGTEHGLYCRQCLEEMGLAEAPDLTLARELGQPESLNPKPVREPRREGDTWFFASETDTEEDEHTVEWSISCSCWGFRRHGHCRHSDYVISLKYKERIEK